jgi:hypothetical protein
MQFQVNPPLFVWEGFRTVGIEGDPNFPGPLDCRLRQTSQHFTLKAAADNQKVAGTQTLTYFVDSLALIPDPDNNAACAAYVQRKSSEMQVMRESYFFDLYQDSSGNLIDTLKQATLSRMVAAKTSDAHPRVRSQYGGCTNQRGFVGHARHLRTRWRWELPD